MYKDPILKSKKKEPVEIDVTDLSDSARSKIVRASELPILIEEKSRSTVLPDETIEHAAENAQPDISDLICVCDPIQFRYVGNISPPCVAPKLYRGAYSWQLIEDPERPEHYIIVLNGYFSKEILWVDDSSIWTERQGMPTSGKLEVLRNNGESRELIDVTAKRDFTVITKSDGKSYIRWEDEQDFSETWMWTGSFLKGTRFTTTNNVGALPGERIVVEEERPEDFRWERDAYWYSFPSIDSATAYNAIRNQGRWYDYGEDWQDYEPYSSIGLYSTASPSTDNFSTEYITCRSPKSSSYIPEVSVGTMEMRFNLGFKAQHIIPRIYEDNKTYAKFNAIRYRRNRFNDYEIDFDQSVTAYQQEYWFTKEG